MTAYISADDLETTIMFQILDLLKRLKVEQRRRVMDYCNARAPHLPIISASGRVIAKGMPEEPPLIRFIRHNRATEPTITGAQQGDGEDVIQQDIE